MPGKKQIGPRIDENIWNRFLDHVERKYGRTRGVTGTELEKALESWVSGTDQDHMEQRMSDLEQQVGALVDTLSERQPERERESSSRNTNARTENTVRDILEHIPQTADLSEDIYEHVISEHGGVTTTKSIKRYKKILRNRGHVFPDPIEGDTYIVGQSKFAMMLERDDRFGPGEVDEVIGAYDDFLGDDWYLDALPDDYIEVNQLKIERLDYLAQKANRYRKVHGLIEESTKDRTFQ